MRTRMIQAWIKAKRRKLDKDLKALGQQFLNHMVFLDPGEAEIESLKTEG